MMTAASFQIVPTAHKEVLASNHSSNSLRTYYIGTWSLKVVELWIVRDHRDEHLYVEAVVDGTDRRE